VDVLHRVLYAFMPKDPLDIKGVFSAVGLHCAFPMAEGCEVYFQQPWVSQCANYSFALFTVVCLHALIGAGEDSLLARARSAYRVVS